MQNPSIEAVLLARYSQLGDIKGDITMRNHFGCLPGASNSRTVEWVAWSEERFNNVQSSYGSV